MQAVNLAHKLSLFTEHFTPKTVGQVNDSLVKLVKFQGEFVWHKHEAEDELFLVIKGSFVMKLRTGDITLSEGEFFIVPRGTEHCPTAAEEVHIMLIEPAGTLNTGDADSHLTKRHLESL